MGRHRRSRLLWVLLGSALCAPASIPALAPLPAAAQIRERDTGTCWCALSRDHRPCGTCPRGGGGASSSPRPSPAPAPTREQLGAEAYNRGLAHARANRWEDAEDAFRRATELLPRDADAHFWLGIARSRRVTPARWQQALELSRAGQVSHQEELLEAAVAALRKAAELGRRDAAAELQPLEAMLGQLRAAFAAARREAREREERERPYVEAFGKGRELYDERRWSEAEEYFRRALRLRPNSVDAYYFLALSLHNQKKLAEAVAAYEEVLRRNPAPREAEGTREWLPKARASLARQRAHEAYRARDWAATEKYVREALRLEPASASAHTLLGAALVNQGRYDDAEAALRAALRLDQNARTRDILADVLVRRADRLGAQRAADAEALYREAIALSPANARAHQMLGVVRQRQRDAAVVADGRARVGATLNMLTPFPVAAPAPPGDVGPERLTVGPAGPGTGGQLGSAYAHGRVAKFTLGEAGVEQARRVFDLPPYLTGPALETVTIHLPRFRDPDIPAPLRNDPAIQQMVAKREAAKKGLAEVEGRRATMEKQPRTPDTDVDIASAKQAETDLVNQIHFYNTEIREYVDLSFKPPGGNGAEQRTP